MNRLEELLLILSEECAEVAQAASKCIRFGMASTHPGSNESNQLRLEQELGDFMAMLKLVVDEARLNESNIIQSADAKLIKVEKFMTNGKPRKGAPPSALKDLNVSLPTANPLETPHRRGKPRKNRR